MDISNADVALNTGAPKPHIKGRENTFGYLLLATDAASAAAFIDSWIAEASA